MANIVQGIDITKPYTEPLSASGGRSIGATPLRELLTADFTERALLIEIAVQLNSILFELQKANELNFPGVNWTNERTGLIDSLDDQISDLTGVEGAI